MCDRGTFSTSDILTNALPTHLRAYRNETITAILDFTKKNQVEAFVREVLELMDG